MIIHACKLGGVSVLNLEGGGSIHFLPPEISVPYPVGLRPLHPEPIRSTISDSDLDQARSQAISGEEARMKQELLEELQITNPALYEKMVLGGELTEEERNTHGGGSDGLPGN